MTDRIGIAVAALIVVILLCNAADIHMAIRGWLERRGDERMIRDIKNKRK